MPSSWWCHSLCAASCLHIRMLAPFQLTWVPKECCRSYAAFTIGPACVGTLMPGVGNAKDMPSVRGRLADLMATFARSMPVHEWTWSPSTSCLACLPHPMAINIFWWPRITLLNGSRPYPCATLRHTRACVHFISLSLAASACLANYTVTRESNFESKLVAELCSIAGINKTRTTPFHPRSDGQTERANRTILQMLRASIDAQPESLSLIHI